MKLDTQEKQDAYVRKHLERDKFWSWVFILDNVGGEILANHCHNMVARGLLEDDGTGVRLK